MNLNSLFTSNSKRIQKVILVFAVLAVASGAYYLGYEKGIKNPEEFIVKGVANIDDDDIKADFAIFWEAWKTLVKEHIEGPKVPESEFLYSSINGLTSAFKDPNTIFLRADNGDAKIFSENISGSFGGIGAEIGLKDEQLVVIAPLKGSPAERVGLQAGDEILKIDSFATVGITVNDAVKKIRGPIGSKVVLNIFRDDWEISKEIPIVRQEIVVPTIDSEVKDDIGIIKLYSFNEKAPNAFDKAARDILSKQPKGLVLDLRNNPGGFLEVAISIAGVLLEKGQVVAIERFRSPTDDRIFRANGNEALLDLPTVVLINEGSASASEILAGALRDHRKIPLVGTKSFGKGTVQQLYSLRDDSQLKITVAKWLVPSGEAIEENGLEPDVKVKITEEDVKAKKDPQLDKALEVLQEEILKAAN